MASVSRSSRGGARRGRLVNEINVVPYIDVMLVLLVIFMVTAPLVPTGTVDVPRLGTANQKPDQFISIEMKQTDSLSLLPANMQTREMRDLPRAKAFSELQLLRAKFPKAPVVISADKSMKYEHVVNLMDELQKIGVSDVKLSVKSGK